MDKLEVLLIRHGTGDHMTPGVVVGRAPLGSLTLEGRKEAKLKGIELAHRGIQPETYISSPLLRCVETGSLIMQAMGIDRPRNLITVSHDLIEMDQGIAVGLPIADAYNDNVKELIALYGNDYAHQDGESVNMVGQRGIKWLDEQADQAQGSNRIIAFTHGGLITATVAQLENWSRDEFDRFRQHVAPVSETSLVYENSRWRLGYFARKIGTRV